MVRLQFESLFAGTNLPERKPKPAGMTTLLSVEYCNNAELRIRIVALISLRRSCSGAGLVV